MHGSAFPLPNVCGRTENLQSCTLRGDVVRKSIQRSRARPTLLCPKRKKGLRWDAISQVAALLKSNVADRPLAALRVEAVFLTMQGGDLQTYINAIHPRATLANGKPAYDGYLLKSPAAPVRINQCATAPAANDPRRAIRKTNVPVICGCCAGRGG